MYQCVVRLYSERLDFNQWFELRFKLALRGSISAMVLALSLVFNISAIAAPPAEALSFWDDNEPGSRLRVNHSAWQTFLTAYVNDSHPSGIHRLDYKAVSEADLDNLTAYLEYLLLLEPRQLNPMEGKAYWINLYNARLTQLVIEAVKEEDIEDSVTDVKFFGARRSPWVRQSIEMLEQKISLENIVNGILRPQFGDRRIHYVLANASLGGPNILATAFTGDNVESLLVAAEKEYLSHSRAVTLRGNTLILSSLFNDYDTDFAGSKAELFDYMTPFVSEDIAAAMLGDATIEYDYDWALNSPSQ